MKENILKRANDIVTQRGKVYGHPRDDFSRTAKIWSGILGIEVTPEQIALCMIGVKMSRLAQTPGHDDSILDMAGYTWCYEQCFEGDKNEDQLELDLESKNPVAESKGAFERLAANNQFVKYGTVCITCNHIINRGICGCRPELDCERCGYKTRPGHIHSCTGF
jgi:hypothetical protein